MSDDADFIFLSIPSLLAVPVFIEDEHGRRPDQNWHREVLEGQYVFLDFLERNRLLADDVRLEKSPELVVRWLQLNEDGRKFTRSEYDKWLRSVDKTGTSADVKNAKLEKRWQKYNQARES